jgi:hypothetical protein
MSSFGVGLRDIGVRQPGYTERIQSFDDAGYCAKRGEGTTRMERRVVRDVVEYSTENMVVG